MQRKNAFLPIDIHLADLGRWKTCTSCWAFQRKLEWTELPWSVGWSITWFGRIWGTMLIPCSLVLNLFGPDLSKFTRKDSRDLSCDNQSNVIQCRFLHFRAHWQTSNLWEAIWIAERVPETQPICRWKLGHLGRSDCRSVFFLAWIKGCDEESAVTCHNYI